jgi:hypothetical protein
MRCALRLTILAAALAATGCATAAQGGGRYHSGTVRNAEPWSESELAPVVSSDPAGQRSTSTDQSGGLGDLAFDLYASYLTKVDGPRCEHRPTCSYYTVLAIRRHGYVVGSMLAIDRLLRGSRSSSLRYLPIYKVEDGRTYFYDPVSNNDFFL